MEEDLRKMRGEGVRRLPEKFVTRAADLPRWFKRICAETKKVKDAVLAKAAAKAGSPAPAPPPEACAPAAVPLPLPGPPVSTSETFGCPKFRHASTGCAQCCPYKAAKKWDKLAAGEAAKEPKKEPAEQAD